MINLRPQHSMSRFLSTRLLAESERYSLQWWRGHSVYVVKRQARPYGKANSLVG
ncbi:hypothetical protein ALP18_200202 [Pseudomonas amygdali pv. myricae]|nr:hypothetical protein ALP18_200202 [Pseudomonas amygdali pv. myricae]